MKGKGRFKLDTPEMRRLARRFDAREVPGPHRARPSMKLAVLVVAVALGAAASLWEPTSAAEPQRRRAPAQRRAPAPPERMTFSHETPAHRRACDACHTFPSANWKEAGVASPDVTEFPSHGACLDCHRTQFFARERPAPRICSVCHVAVTPRETSRLPFPNPVARFRQSARARDFVSQFRVRFPHVPHVAMLGRARPGEADLFARVAFRRQEADASCAACHQTYQPGDDYVTPPPAGFDGFWLKQGTFKTAPEGHATCFECHSPDSGLSPAPSECAGCHVLAGGARAPVDFDPAAAARMKVDDPFVLKAWRRRDDSATFPHDGGLHADISCASCHDVAAMDAAGGRSDVRIQSCGGADGCHVTATVDEGGALTFEMERRKTDPTFACTKCHVGYATRPVPAGHAEAVASPVSIRVDSRSPAVGSFNALGPRLESRPARTRPRAETSPPS